MGDTRIVCTATIEDRVPTFLRGSGRGWVTAEYSMLPRSTQTRTPREIRQGSPTGRTQEIQRLVGRALRAGVDTQALGERTIVVDCDVLQADGGTRTAAITGGYVALYQATLKLVRAGILPTLPFTAAIAAISAGVVGNNHLLDLTYEEDVRASLDFNVVMTDNGQLIEVQGTAEGQPFSRDTLLIILDLAEKGIRRLLTAQQEAVKNA